MLYWDGYGKIGKMVCIGNKIEEPVDLQPWKWPFPSSTRTMSCGQWPKGGRIDMGCEVGAQGGIIISS